MNTLNARDRRVFDIMLLVVAVGMTYLLYRMGAYKMVILNLFFLPIVLSGYFLGRTSSGILALFSVLCVTVVTTLDPTGLAVYQTPILAGLALTVWGGALGLTAILVGTLCDERAKTVDELHAAYVGVVEVLSKYLQSADPKVKARSTRIAELSEAVARELKLTRKDVDDVRVGALLYDLGNLEITTQLLTKAVGTLEADHGKANAFTFSGSELSQSIGSVLSRAVPLLISQDDAVRECLPAEADEASAEVPTGAKIIRAVRGLDALTTDEAGDSRTTVPEAIQELRKDLTEGHDPEVLDAMERCLRRTARETASAEPVCA